MQSRAVWPHTKALCALLDALALLPTMPLVDAREDLADPQDLARVDRNVGGLARRAARRFCLGSMVYNEGKERARGVSCDVRWIMILECGSACRLPFSPAARSNEPIEHAWPTQYVCIGDDTYYPPHQPQLSIFFIQSPAYLHLKRLHY